MTAERPLPEISEESLTSIYTRFASPPLSMLLERGRERRGSWVRRSVGWKPLGLVPLLPLAVTTALVAAGVAYSIQHHAHPPPLASAPPIGIPATASVGVGPTGHGQSGTPKMSAPAGTATPGPTGAPHPTPPLPPGTPPPSLPPAPGFPDASNTGVPAGVPLTASGDVNVTTDGTTVDALDVTGSITVNANNVTIKRTRIHTDSTDAVTVVSGSVTVSDVEVIGGGGPQCQRAIIGSNYTAIRMNIHDCGGGFVVDSNVVIQDSYIHNLYSGSNNVYWPSGTSLKVIHNSMPDCNGSACLFMAADNGPISNAQVSNNRLNGGSYTIYWVKGSSHSATGLAVNGNRFGHGAIYGPMAATAPFTQAGNVWDDTGQALTL